jgi:Protein of unknown function (DUF4019)
MVAKEEMMRTLTSRMLLAVLLTMGLAGEAGAQTSSEVRHIVAPRGQSHAAEPSHTGSVKITQTPIEEATIAQAPPSETPMAAPAPPAAANGSVREELAITAARDWLALVDSGNYAAAYDQAGEIFRGNTPREQWQAGLENSRRTVGPLMERSMKSAVVAIDLPNAPKGEYVVTTFETKFQQNPQPVPEIVTALLTGGQWKVVGYLIRPVNGAQGQNGHPAQKPSR